MHVIILKYVQVLCITIFFSNNINCDKLLLHNEQEDQELYRIGACTAACMVGAEGSPASPATPAEAKSIERCYSLCSEDRRPESAWRPLVQRRQPSLRINLICRDSTNLIVEVRPSEEPFDEEVVVSADAANGERNHAPRVDAAANDTTRGEDPLGKANQLDVEQDTGTAGVAVTDGEVSKSKVTSGASRRRKRAIGTGGGHASPGTSQELVLSERQKPAAAGNHLLTATKAGRRTSQPSASTVHASPGSRSRQPIYLVKVQESEKELGDRIVYMCPYTKLQRIAADKRHTIVKVDVARQFGLRVLDRDVGQYSYPNDSNFCQLSNLRLGEFGVYDLRLLISGNGRECALETAKEPVNVYLPFLTLALICAALLGAVRFARYGLKRTRPAAGAAAAAAGTTAAEEEDIAEGSDKPSAAAAATAQAAKKRLQSLDTFRGVAIMLMIFVNSGGGHYWWIEHATWNGLHVADLVFPWFLFIMGVCVPISLRGQLSRNVPRRTIASNIAISNSSLVKIENLVPNKRYNITATMLTSEYEYYYVEKGQFRTLPLEYMPGAITEVMVERYETNAKDSRLVDAVIAWNPAKDKTCHYEILYHADHTPDFQLKPIDVQQPEVLYKYKIKALELSANYQIAIRSKNTQNPERESQLQWHEFKTPICTNLTNGSQICAPEAITNVRVTQVPLYDDHYQLNISWDRPRVSPEYYVVKVFDLHDTGTEDQANSYTRNLTGEVVGLFIDSFEMFGPHFEVLISAYSSVGVTQESTIKTLQISRASTDSWLRTKLVFIILTPVLMIGLLKISISLICRRRAKLKRYEERCEYFKDLEQKAPVDPSTEFEPTSKHMQDLLASSPFPPELMTPINDELEIDSDHILLQDMLGEGAFGLVRKGVLHRNGPDELPRSVAVKMLKECPRVEDIIEFRREMEVMKSVGSHPHIVSIVGHCTKNVRKMMLLTEYCGRGNLLNYLRLQWQRILRQHRESTTKALSQSVTPSETVATASEEQTECLTPSLDNNKLPENVFNFDTSFVNDKKSLTYKNITDQRQNGAAFPGPESTRPQIIENKLYPLFNDDSTGEEVGGAEKQATFCTSSCRNVVEIVSSQRSEAQGGGDDCSWGTAKGSLKINPCSCDDASAVTHNTVENRCYHSCPQSSQPQQESPLASKPKEEGDAIPDSVQLLEFSRQIALGMEFLARNKVVHRDLAARNVLVCSDNTVKIADFGLSRDIYQENLYRKTSNGKLPIKWLALESMTHQVYTSQSDVWAYGILLYEICTLGGSPYPAISTGKLLRYLENGYRMERPKSCSEELYDLMYSCWTLHPGERPTFSKIVRTVEMLQSKDTSGSRNGSIIDLNAIVDVHCTKNSPEENSYLKPVEY